MSSGDDEGIHCIGADRTYRFHLSKGASVRDLASQLAAETGQAGSLSIRIFCRGRELRHHELAASIGTSPVHYVLCPEGPLSRASSVDYGAAGLLDSYDLPREQTDDQDAWIDALDPCALLMVVFAAVLGGFWLAFFIYPTLFDGASLAMLATMTIAYVLPAIYQRVPIFGPVMVGPDNCYHHNAPQNASGVLQQHNYHRTAAAAPPVAGQVSTKRQLRGSATASK